MTIDLATALKAFLDNPIRVKRSMDGDDDSTGIAAVQERHRPLADRQLSMAGWLRHYKVLMGFNTEQGYHVATVVIRFADENRFPNGVPDHNSILTAFTELEAGIQNVLPRTPSGKVRNVTSLTSKALWCCFPSQVPIFDWNAASALKVLARTARITTLHPQDSYAAFADIWLRIYSELSPILEHRALPCENVRVFDRFLWDIGQLSFETSIIEASARDQPQ